MLNWLLDAAGLPAPAWLTEPRLALPAIIIGDMCEWFPFTMLGIANISGRGGSPGAWAAT